MNLITATRKDFADIMAAAVKIGAVDESAGTTAKTATELLDALGVREHRKGHATALRQAYSAGRFHISSMAK